MLKHHGNLLHTFHPLITCIKRYSALDATAFPITQPPTYQKQKRLKRIPRSIPQTTTALAPTATTQQTKTTEDKRTEKFRDKFEGTYHFHRRFFCDSITKEHLVNNFEWIRLSRILKHPYSQTQRLFIQNLFKHHSITYIRYLFQIWGIEMRSIGNYKHNNPNFDHFLLRTLTNYRNKESMQIMLSIFHKLLYEHQQNQKRVVPLDDIVKYIDTHYYNNTNTNDMPHPQKKSDIIKILQSFRQFVVLEDKHSDSATDSAQKNPVISVWAQIGNILQMDDAQQFVNNKYFEKSQKFMNLQHILMQNDFYSTLCLMYQIFGVAKNFNCIHSSETDHIKNKQNLSLSDEENQLFIPINPSQTLIKDTDIILRLDSNVINAMNENGLLPNNLPLILNKLQQQTQQQQNPNNNEGDDEEVLICSTNIMMDGVWSIFNNIQNVNDLSLMVLPTYIYGLISSMNYRKNKSSSNNDNIFQWLGAQCFSLNSRKRVIKSNDDIGVNDRFNIIGIEGDIMNKRKLWFLLCYLPCTLGSNWIQNDELSILCWLSTTIKGWEFELSHYATNQQQNKNESEQRLFEYYCNEYRRIIRDILSSHYREDIVCKNGQLLISRLAYIYLNDHLPNKWLNEDWFMLAKLCPIIVNNEEYVGMKELNALIFLTETLKRLNVDNADGSNEIMKGLKRLINDKNFVLRLSKSLKGNNESYIEFLETLCVDSSNDIIDTNAIHLFMETILLPSADFVAAFNLLKFMIANGISMNINTISLFMNICEYANNTNIMYDVYNKLYNTLGTKICHNADILKCILRMFLKDNRWNWLDEVFQNVYHNNDDGGEDGIAALQKCYVQLIDILVVLTKNDEVNRMNVVQKEEGQRKNNAIIVNKELVTNILIDVFNEEKYSEALMKLITKTFEEYRKYLHENSNNSKSKGVSDRYIVYKMNVLQDLIAKSDSKSLLNKWDKLIIKLQKR